MKCLHLDGDNPDSFISFVYFSLLSKFSINYKFDFLWETNDVLHFNILTL